MNDNHLLVMPLGAPCQGVDHAFTCADTVYKELLVHAAALFTSQKQAMSGNN